NVKTFLATHDKKLQTPDQPDPIQYPKMHIFPLLRPEYHRFMTHQQTEFTIIFKFSELIDAMPRSHPANAKPSPR
ncbi:MAG: hypothetical protein LBH14_07700, partial [Desulfobulbaceae bacterium]|nr:hypothetical protein [Desulfobulbaceae bacterium]